MLEELTGLKGDEAATIERLRVVNPKFVTDPRRTS
jgi:hypothetical protein